MKPIWSSVVAFGSFWYRFIVGDDWTVAAAVVFGLLATAFLNARAVAAWWLVPVLVVVMVVVSLRRASPHRNFLREAQEEKK
ncbi:MAG TPA: hypothetical protein VFH00_10575 [Candidatus Nitrosotalea sp.]|nr:hypothetical protein [Candidatus Nitrosotalea sp.]